MEAVGFSNCISVLLLEDAEGWTLVDTGVGLSPERIRKALATLGATPEALKRVYLIHHYPDHVGCLPGVQ